MTTHETEVGGVVPFAKPDVTEREIAAVVEVMRSGWLTSGVKAREFELRFAEAVQGEHAVSVNSATAALHLTIEALGIGPGDAVFVPTYTFAASAEVVRYVGATPVLVDVDASTSNIDPDALVAAIESAIVHGKGTPKAIMPVHFAGVACDMESIWAIARRFDLAVVEDAAHAFPAMHGDRPVGWMPIDIRGAVCFSFYATKTITTGEGGMLVTPHADIAERARVMSLHGLSKQAWNRYAGGSWKYDIVAPGFKYNLTDMAAAMGLVQLERASALRDRRASIAETYSEALGDYRELTTPPAPAGAASAWHLYPLRLASGCGEPTRDLLIERLRTAGVGTSVHFIPLHLHSYYRESYGYQPHDFPVALDLYERELSLPIWSGMSDPDVNRVVRAVQAAVGCLS